MEESSFQEKEGMSVGRLSESRPVLKPVLVKKLLDQSESDDDSEDDTVNYNSDEELDEGLSPLSEESSLKIEKMDADLPLINNMELTKPIQSNTNGTEIDENKGTLSSCSKESTTHMDSEGVNEESLCQLKSISVLDKQKPFLHRSHSAGDSYLPQINVKKEELQDEQIKQHRFSMKQNKPLLSNEAINEVPPKTGTSHATTVNSNELETPMKQPHLNFRPTPCHSHRNIFQTPQNKIGSDVIKNSLQTPATIFSHWSQQHMLQTPMQNQLTTSKESIQTPITNSSLSQNSRESSRIHSADKKRVRRPLAETMSTSQPYVSQSAKLQELPHVSHLTPPISKETNNQLVKQEHHLEKQLGNIAVVEVKENNNPNKHEMFKNEQHQKISMASDHNREIRSNVLIPHNVVPPKKVTEDYSSHKQRETHNAHPPPTNYQSQPVQNINTVSQKNNPQNPNQYKTIIVQDRQYMVLGILGYGMSCEVYRAQDLHSSELRAIKCVNMSKFDKDSAQGCLQEICLLDKLKAPCIVHMYNFETKLPMLYVVMEMGDTDLSRLLKSMLQEKKRIPLTMVLYYWTEILTAVKHIHDNGVIHTDLKPANFLLVKGRLKLIDFGIASNINADMTSVVRNSSVGTLNYISPEALIDTNVESNNSPNHNNKYKLTYKSDVWSLGCILYHMVYNTSPFGHIRNQFAKVSAIIDPKAKIKFPFSNGSEDVPKILIDVMNRCLQYDVKARPTVADLLKVPYLQNNLVAPVIPNIPNSILVKIKHALTNEEWKQFTEGFDKKS